MSEKPPAGLRLVAEDGVDLKIISAAVQDAVARLGDIRFEPKSRRLTLELNRFRWEAPAPRRGGERVRSALQFVGVLSVQGRKLRREASDAVVSLLSIDFHPADELGGAIVLTFAGGGQLRCEVECVDALLVDVTAPWPTRSRPEHGLAD